jgi:hypothetical protein
MYHDDTSHAPQTHDAESVNKNIDAPDTNDAASSENIGVCCMREIKEIITSLRTPA